MKKTIYAMMLTAVMAVSLVVFARQSEPDHPCGPPQYNVTLENVGPTATSMLMQKRCEDVLIFHDGAGNWRVSGFTP